MAQLLQRRRRERAQTKAVATKKRKIEDQRPQQRTLLLRPSLVFGIREEYWTDVDPDEVVEFDFKAKNEDQRIIAAFTSGENLRWMATSYVHKTGHAFRQMTELPVTLVSALNSPSWSPTSPSWSPMSPSYDNDRVPSETFYHLSRYVKAYEKLSRLAEIPRILLDVNEILLDVDFWIRSCKGLDVPALADIILGYYNVFDTVSVRKKSPELLADHRAVNAVEAAWFIEDTTDYSQECALCASFRMCSDCPRCWKTW